MFALRGPEFLVLFVGLAVVVYGVVDRLIAAREEQLPADSRIRDPYAIAFLRGNARELLRVAAMSLVLRRLLAVEGKVFLTIDAAEIARVQAPIEKSILRLCQTPCSAPGLVADPGFVAAAEEYRRDLVSRGLLADAAVRQQRWLYVGAGILVLLGIAAIKIQVALSTGHSNIVFLVILAGVSTAVLAARAVTRQSAAGRAALLNLRNLFGSLRRSRSRGAQASGATEAALLAAVFGVYTVAGFDRIAWARMFPNSNSDSGGGGCGSSGGCGGGGGGCGGCGS